MPTLFIMCGLPAAGKTTLAKKIELERPALRLTPDDWMQALGIDQFDEPARAKIEALQWQIAERALKLGIDVVLDWSLWGRDERERYRKLAKSLGARSELIYVPVSRESQLERLSIRNPEWLSPECPFSEEMLDEWAALFQQPVDEELTAREVA